MGCCILVGVNADERPAAVLYDSVTQHAFGPLMPPDEAREFLDYCFDVLGVDPREWTGDETETQWVRWKDGKHWAAFGNAPDPVGAS